jgi:hypothetical protein
VQEADLETATVQRLAFDVPEFKEALTDLTLPIYKDIWAAAVEELDEELAEIGLLPPEPA